ncbi:MAG: beta-N-acetylhexosaminidase [Phycisphaerae bacterium]
MPFVRHAGFILIMATASAAFGTTPSSSRPIISADSLSLIPMPRHITVYKATWSVPTLVKIKADRKSQRRSANFLAAFLKRRGIEARVVRSGPAPISFLQIKNDPELGHEGYRLDVRSDGAVLEASAGPGYFYALQTFEELFNSARCSNHAIHEVTIADHPRYRWRGIMLDCSRHFFTPPVVKQFIRLAAHYKLNIFHWHLTDDQGWRIEIPQYPRLTGIGAWRAGTEVGGNPHDINHRRYGGFYTDAQIRQIVAYAARRYVTVVPEIDIPGHCTAALAAYPWLAAGNGPFQVREIWGISNVPLSPSRRTFDFLDTVFGDLTQIFPGRFIHLGGDEVSAAAMKAWAQDPVAERIMQKQHWTPERLHDYFPTRIARFLAARGRRAVVWNDVPAKSLPHNTVIECWNSSGIVAHDAALGHDVIVANEGRLYFNFCQGDPRYEPHPLNSIITLRDVYDYNPSSLLPRSLRPRLLGAEACLWSERIATARHLFYQALPREMALAEICWTPRQKQNYAGFLRRSGGQYTWLMRHHYNFCIPQPQGEFVPETGHAAAKRVPARNLITYQTSSATGLIRLHDSIPGAVIRYTLNGTVPMETSPQYRRPISVSITPKVPVVVRSIAFLKSGRCSAPARLKVKRTAQ